MRKLKITSPILGFSQSVVSARAFFCSWPFDRASCSWSGRGRPVPPEANNINYYIHIILWYETKNMEIDEVEMLHLLYRLSGKRDENLTGVW